MGNSPSNDNNKGQQSPSHSKQKKELTAETLSKAQRRKLQSLCKDDEWNFSLGILNMLVTVVIAVRFPAYYWLWHILRTSIYLPARYIRFKAKKWHLYLLDWCYVVTYLSTTCSILAFVRVTTGLSTVLIEYNQDLIHAGFAMACGPLAWAVFIFRNSVVFHDLEHSTSVFIHISPFVLFWCLRWGSGVPSVIETTWPTMFHVCTSSSDFDQADDCLATWQGMFWCNACSASPWAFVLPPAILYLIWAVPYYLIVLVSWREWCEQTNHDTLYSYMVETHPGMRKWLEDHFRPIVGENHAVSTGFMVCHFLVTVTFCSTAYLVWHSFFLHTLGMVVVLTKAVQNGATYMFRIFAYRYVSEKLDEHRDIIEKVD